MADPITLTALAATAASGIMEGIAGKQAANANASIAKQNERISLNQAASEEARLRREADDVTGAQVAATGASGITIEGSPSDVIAQSKRNAELDALNARYAGHIKAVGYRNEARSQKAQGNQGLAAGIIKGLGGAATFAASQRLLK